MAEVGGSLHVWAWGMDLWGLRLLRFHHGHAEERDVPEKSGFAGDGPLLAWSLGSSRPVRGLGGVVVEFDGVRVVRPLEVV